jgi:hypothetical protein
MALHHGPRHLNSAPPYQISGTVTGGTARAMHAPPLPHVSCGCGAYLGTAGRQDRSNNNNNICIVLHDWLIIIVRYQLSRPCNLQSLLLL